MLGGGGPNAKLNMLEGPKRLALHAMRVRPNTLGEVGLNTKTQHARRGTLNAKTKQATRTWEPKHGDLNTPAADISSESRSESICGISRISDFNSILVWMARKPS
ncbi:hypothetical protein RRG08_025563 [Elysia crispata]|uniref:Uncharacterized protein n=1 Tax=Elysia crispata TaxID=231223 RepID=A0AAE1A0Z5_9GAST|nr:hypothetical protein RRG08_025563 [Elysia crispata]